MVNLRLRRSEDADAQHAFAKIVDGPSAKVWLAALGSPGSRETMEHIGELLAEINGGPLSPEKRYDIFERTRVVIHTALTERIRDNEFHSVPLTTAEAEMVWGLVDAAESLREAYELLIPRLAERAPFVPSATQMVKNPPEPPPTKVMALHRALDLNGHVLVVYLRMRVAIPERIWDQHCRLGQLVRQLNVQNEEVEDALNASLTDTCRAAFNVPILLALADPAALTLFEFKTALSCVLRWAGKVGFRIYSTRDDGEIPQRPVGNPGPVVPLVGGDFQVRLDTQKLDNSIERRLAGLDEGASPRALGLGDGISSASARSLLQGLRRRWGPITPESIDFPEQVWRPSPSEFALAVVGAAHADDTGSRPTAAPAAPNAPTYDYQRMREDALTRSQGELERARIDRLLQDAETWTVVGETPDSILAVRRHSRPRLSLGQLVGVKLGGKASATPFLLGSVAGLQQGVSENDQGTARPASTHLVRLRLIPGLPQAVRAAVEKIDLEPVYLMVPHQSAMEADSVWDQVRMAPEAYGLLLPLATFRPERTIRVVAGGIVAHLRLDTLVTRGLDYDYVRFTPV